MARASAGIENVLPATPDILGIPDHRADKRKLSPAREQNEGQELVVATRLTESARPETSHPHVETCTQDKRRNHHRHSLRQPQTQVVPASPSQTPRRLEDACLAEAMLSQIFAGRPLIRIEQVNANRANRNFSNTTAIRKNPFQYSIGSTASRQANFRSNTGLESGKN